MSRRNQTWYVYLLKCADGTFYTGMTLDPQRRTEQHNLGRGARYTRTRLPVRLLGSIAVPSYGEALRLERLVKRWPPKSKHAFFVNESEQNRSDTEDT